MRLAVWQACFTPGEKRRLIGCSLSAGLALLVVINRLAPPSWKRPLSAFILREDGAVSRGATVD